MYKKTRIKSTKFIVEFKYVKISIVILYKCMDLG